MRSMRTLILNVPEYQFLKIRKHDNSVNSEGFNLTIVGAHLEPFG